jgi:hypothetical protein
MRTETINLYQFHELGEDAKEKALQWLRQAYEYPWFDECVDSLRAFCDVFGVSVKNCELGYGQGFVTTDAKNHHFRGFTLKDALRLTDSSLTGFCFDYDLTQTFYDSFKRSGDALEAFSDALHSFCIAVRNDVENSYSDEALTEWSDCNQFEFLESGKKA